MSQLTATAKDVRNGIQRVRVHIRGAVQGVGFRPFVYRLATKLELFGLVNNSPDGVTVEIEGPTERLRSFLSRLSREKPPRSFIESVEESWLDPSGHSEFVIGKSENSGEKAAIILPDIATCPDCLSEILDPEDRRYKYPFTNCTNCGPRYSIIRELPYDRPNTTMAGFEMCEACLAEYEDPLDRRFHAQPNACPDCGPQLALWNATGDPLATRNDALIAAADAIRAGRIVALKGLGGFHLICDARNNEAVHELRRRKHREQKPLALMVASVEAVHCACFVSDLERSLLASPESPIVLLRAKNKPNVSSLIAPRNPYLGVMLPYTPLHHLLMRELQLPVVATSGNLSDEPICIDEYEALERLSGIADSFLVHDRNIERHVDDSILRVMMGREMILRRARGYAPLPFPISGIEEPVVAVGAHLKNTVAVAVNGQAYISQHIGDLETTQAFNAFSAVIEDVERLYEVHPSLVVCDLHPDYASTKWATEFGPSARVQHHYAHILSCMAENGVSAPCLGIAWDGTGYGNDGTIWGGEFLCISDNGFERAAHLRTFRLPGGDRAVREPRRAALGLLFEVLGEKVFDRRDLFPVVSFSVPELKMIKKMLAEGINAPLTSSAGRLFDAVASILGLRERVAFEGQAAMELEFLADTDEPGKYDFAFGDSILDWEPMLRELISDMDSGGRPAIISAKFHNTLVEMMAAVANKIGVESVALSGGCFQNRYLLEHAVERLRRDGFRVYWHRRIPTNDGGIALGQIAAVANTAQNPVLKGG